MITWWLRGCNLESIQCQVIIGDQLLDVYWFGSCYAKAFGSLNLIRIDRAIFSCDPP